MMTKQDDHTWTKTGEMLPSRNVNWTKLSETGRTQWSQVTAQVTRHSYLEDHYWFCDCSEVPHKCHDKKKTPHLHVLQNCQILVQLGCRHLKAHFRGSNNVRPRSEAALNFRRTHGRSASPTAIKFTRTKCVT
jgi:hypothetical protein